MFRSGCKLAHGSLEMSLLTDDEKLPRTAVTYSPPSHPMNENTIGNRKRDKRREWTVNVHIPQVKPAYRRVVLFVAFLFFSDCLLLGRLI